MTVKLIWLKEHAHCLITLAWWLHSYLALRIANRNKVASSRLMTISEHETVSIYTVFTAYGTFIVSTVLCLITYLMRNQP